MTKGRGTGKGHGEKRSPDEPEQLEEEDTS